MGREAQVVRTTKETDVRMSLRLEGTGEGQISTSVPFFDHMLTLFSRHGFFDLTVTAKGDTDVDYHHVVEDVGICLGEAFRKSLGNMGGIARYAHASIPMIEALAHVTVDVSARPHLVFHCPLPGEKVGSFDLDLSRVFSRAFTSPTGRAARSTALTGPMPTIPWRRSSRDWGGPCRTRCASIPA